MIENKLIYDVLEERKNKTDMKRSPPEVYDFNNINLMSFGLVNWDSLDLC